jgi:hypothetical protein
MPALALQDVARFARLLRICFCPSCRVLNREPVRFGAGSAFSTIALHSRAIARYCFRSRASPSCAGMLSHRAALARWSPAGGSHECFCGLDRRGSGYRGMFTEDERKWLLAGRGFEMRAVSHQAGVQGMDR